MLLQSPLRGSLHCQTRLRNKKYIYKNKLNHSQLISCHKKIIKTNRNLRKQILFQLLAKNLSTSIDTHPLVQRAEIFEITLDCTK